MNEPRKYLLELGLSDSEVTVYLAMIAGARTARDLVKATSLKRPTVYYALGCLEKRGLMGKSGLEGDKKFILEPLKHLELIADEKIRNATALKGNVLEMIPSLQSEVSPASKPAVAFFEGADGVKNVIMDMLYCKGKQIHSVVPKNNFFWQIGRDFVTTYVEERVKRGIRTKNLWEAPIETVLIKKYYEGLSEVRIVPDVMKGKFETTVFLYDDKTLYVSSKKNSYCVRITSKEHHDTMLAWFEGLWSVSKPHRK